MEEESSATAWWRIIPPSLVIKGLGRRHRRTCLLLERKRDIILCCFSQFPRYEFVVVVFEKGNLSSPAAVSAPRVSKEICSQFCFLIFEPDVLEEVIAVLEEVIA